MRTKPVVILPSPMVPPFQPVAPITEGSKGQLIPAAPTSPPPAPQPGNPRLASPGSTGGKGACVLVILEATDEDFEMRNSSTPQAPRRSREKTRATERSPKTLSARIAPLVEELTKKCEKLESISAEQKMDLAELRDDLCHGLCAKMRRLFEATGHEDLYDAE